MINKKTLFLGTLLISLLLVVSCTNQSEKNAVNYNFKEGYSGLNMNLLENAPPDKLYPNSKFKIIVKIDNQAAYDVYDSKIKIVGLNEKYFKLDFTEQNFIQLEGKSLTFPNGMQKFIEFPGNVGELTDRDRYKGTYYLKTSYNSNLEFTTDVCINPNYLNTYNAECETETLKSFYGQGAPIAVTQLEQVTSPGTASTAEFRFKIQNKGKGKVKKIILNKALLGPKELNCLFANSLQNIVTLKSDQQETILICTKNLDNQKVLPTTLYLGLSYEYELKERHELNLIGTQLQI